MVKLEDTATWPRLGSVWQHKNGNVYVVTDFTNVETNRQDEYPTTIVYQNARTHAKYSRRLMDWDRSMTILKP